MSTASTGWHVDDDLLAAYARGDVDDAHAFSVEAHLVACERCQAALRRHVDLERIERGWLDVVDALDAPRPRPVEALLVRVGVRPHVARLLAATPSLTASWLGAVAIALAVAVAGAHGGDRGVALFLCLAALAPVAGVAATFGRGIDPTHELSLAAPMSSVRLLLLRSVAVVTATLAVTAVAAIALPGVGWTAAAWLLPALGLTLASLALSTYVAPATAFGTVTGVWLAAVIAGAAKPDDALAAFDGAVQPVFACIIAAATLVLVRRRESLDGWSTR
jgi:hypothetical protein